MAKTVTIGSSNITHLSVSDKHLSPLCGATYPGLEEGSRTAGTGDVKCTHCKQVLEQAVKNALASK
jgi:hypothetical protein